MVTIKDVAAKAGVNPSTVSRVLKDSKSISQKTKDKVRKAMAELGYVPNVAAQMLASGLTYNVFYFSTVNHTRSFERTILYANSFYYN